MIDDATLSRQHSVPSRRCRVRDLSLERHSPMKEQPYASINGRAKPTPPPSIPQDYYGTLTNRASPGWSAVGRSCDRERHACFLDEVYPRHRNGGLPSEPPSVRTMTDLQKSFSLSIHLFPEQRSSIDRLARTATYQRASLRKAVNRLG